MFNAFVISEQKGFYYLIDFKLLIWYYNLFDYILYIAKDVVLLCKNSMNNIYEKVRTIKLNNN